MEAVAITKNSRGSAQKARLVIDMIRGRSVNDALAILSHTNKRAAAPIKRTLDSAIANAVQNADRANILVDVDDLTVRVVKQIPAEQSICVAYARPRWDVHIASVGISAISRLR